jgi:hypothetical protein
MKLIDNTQLLTVFFLFLSTFVMAMIRPEHLTYIFSVIVTMYVYKLYKSDRKTVNTIFTSILLLIFFIIGKNAFAYTLSLERINGLASNMARGDSAYLTNIYAETLPDLLWYVPLQGIYFQFSPFIWDLVDYIGPLAIVAFLQASIVLLIVLITLFNIRSHLVTWKIGLTLFSVISVSFMLGIGVKNTGSALRWRTPTVLLILSIASTTLYKIYANNGSS